MEDAQTIVRDFTVENKYGIHARPAALLVKAAAKFVSDIHIGKEGAEVSAKSIMGLLTIEGHQGAVLRVQVVGEDAQEAMEKIAELFENNFFEE
jgi:phosphocarrier protein